LNRVIKWVSQKKRLQFAEAKYDGYVNLAIFRQLLPKLKSKIAAAELPNHA